MRITYGICVAPNYNEKWLYKLLNSIEVQYYNFINKYDDWEVILVGGGEELAQSLSYRSDMIGKLHRCIPFDETRPGWITKKKNIIAQEAKYDNLCIMHDYVQIGNTWRLGVEETAKLNRGWQVMLNRVQTLEGKRSADWLVDPKYMLELIARDSKFDTNFGETLMKAAPHENGPQYVSGLPYTIRHLNHIQYVSGAFFLVKRDVLLDNPFNESMIWGDAPGEDVEWSRRLNERCIRYTWNNESDVRLLKPNKWHLHEMPDEVVNGLSVVFGRS